MMLLRRIAGQAARYVVTGGTAAVVDSVGFWILTELEIGVALAAVLSFAVAAVVNYAFTARFVFAQRPTPRQFLGFFAMALIGLAVNVSITMVLALQLGVSPVPSKIVGIGVAFFINFSLNVWIVFRDRSH